MLGKHRIQILGATPFAHEAEAIDFAISALPNSAPYNLWALCELLDPSTGRLYEIDLLVIGYSALYLIEVKSGPGVYEGDSVDWWRTPPGEPRRWMDPPLALTNRKAKVLKSRLERVMPPGRRVPWIEALVLLSHPDTTLRLSEDGRCRVVKREGLVRAIQHHEFEGASPGYRADRIDAPTLKDLVTALGALGLRKQENAAYVGPYALRDVLMEGQGFQDRLAVHRDQPSMRRRARTYLVPQQTSVERRQQLRRAADREAQLLTDLREHPQVLSLTDYMTDAAIGPTVLFDPFEEGVPLDAFLRQQPKLTFFERVSLITQVGRALAFCHRKSIVHGALSPEAVLVRPHRENGEPEVRLFNFQLGHGSLVEATSHVTMLISSSGSVYQAPETRFAPTARSVQSDLFSLGALAYFVLTGRSPAGSDVELEERLRRDHHLDPRAADESIPEDVASLVAEATEIHLQARSDDVTAWIELLLDVATQPAPVVAPAQISPLLAKADEVLEGGLRVVGLLGHGSTARVLHVQDPEGRDLALKVSQSEDHDARLEAEAGTIRELHHGNVVSLTDSRVIAGRRCLLLSIAGTETLQRRIGREGSLSLDFAARFGGELLDALHYLEEKQVFHRDIKPANIGVGAVGKTREQLTLFDFSLSSADPAEVGLGTAAYRDPFLRDRGVYDGAAERWSAAVTLHEMVTGLRPEVRVQYALAPGGGAHPIHSVSASGVRGDAEAGHPASGSSLAVHPPGGPPVTTDAPYEVSLSAERFDPSVRTALLAFFRQALHPAAGKRFSSAEVMHEAWKSAFETQPRRSAVARRSVELVAVSDADMAALSPDTPIEVLPLSVRARSALDRAGLTRAEEILRLPDNRLSAVRGIGTGVSREILEFRDRLRNRAATPAPAEPFYPGYQGEDLALQLLGLPGAEAFTDAGLDRLSRVALAEKAQVEALAQKHGLSAKVLRELLDREQKAAEERKRPTTVEGWVEALFGGKSKAHQHVRALFGLEDPFLGLLGIKMRTVADHFRIAAPNISVELGKRRDQWEKHPARGELASLCRSLVEQAGGALPLVRAARELLAQMPHDRDAAEPLRLGRAAALVRAMAEVERDSPEGLRYLRLQGDDPWVVLSEAYITPLKRLGAAADDLAQREPLVAAHEAMGLIAEAIKGAPFERLAPERLLALATQASDQAALSARLEVYPRGMPAARALELSAQLLRSKQTPDEVSQVVRSRYPEAEVLPARPELDDLMVRLGFDWIEREGRYLRPEGAVGPSLHTSWSSLTIAGTALPSQARSMEPEAIRARDFDDRLRYDLEKKNLLVLGVTADRAREATLALAKRIGVPFTSFDEQFLAALAERSAEKKVKDDALHGADCEGAEGRAWPLLLKLAREAAAQVADAMLPPKQTLLLVQPGLIARYGLTDFLSRLVEASKDKNSAAILVLVPAHDTGGVPRIEGKLALPDVRKSQAAWIPREWLANRHNAPGQAD